MEPKLALATRFLGSASYRHYLGHPPSRRHFLKSKMLRPYITIDTSLSCSGCKIFIHCDHWVDRSFFHSRKQIPISSIQGGESQTFMATRQTLINPVWQGEPICFTFRGTDPYDSHVPQGRPHIWFYYCPRDLVSLLLHLCSAYSLSWPNLLIHFLALGSHSWLLMAVNLSS